MKSLFLFNKGQRNGILLLLILIISSLIFYHFIDLSDEEVLNLNSPEILALQKELDSLHLAHAEDKKPKIFPFNPNFLTDYRGYSLGMSNEEIDRLLAFRGKGNWVNSPEDFQKATGVSDSLLSVLKPYLKFPDFKRNTTSAKSAFPSEILTHSEKIDLNLATEDQLREIRGIGEVLSKRIISFRDRLGGFSHENQLYAVYGLDSLVIQRALQRFAVKTPKEIQRMNINTASASDISTIPGISFDQGKKIWEFRKLRGRISDLEELLKIEEISEFKFRVIQLYLFAE